MHAHGDTYRDNRVNRACGEIINQQLVTWSQRPTARTTYDVAPSKPSLGLSVDSTWKETAAIIDP